MRDLAARSPTARYSCSRSFTPDNGGSSPLVLDDRQLERARLAVAFDVDLQPACPLEGAERGVGLFGMLEGHAVDAEDDVARHHVDEPLRVHRLDAPAAELAVRHRGPLVELDVAEER